MTAKKLDHDRLINSIQILEEKLEAARTDTAKAVDNVQQINHMIFNNCMDADAQIRQIKLEAETVLHDERQNMECANRKTRAEIGKIQQTIAGIF